MSEVAAWPFVKLASLASFKNGLNFAGTSWGLGMKIIGVSDFKDRMFPDFSSLDQINPKGVVRPKDLLKQGDIVFVRSNGNRNLIGRSLYLKRLEEPVSHSGFTIRLRFESDKVCIPFFVYLFRSPLIRRALSDFGGGTNINNLNQDILSKLDVPLPEKSTQQKIAAILSAYDDLIANNQRRITLLEGMAEDIYREWFVRLRFPGHESVKIEKGVPQGWEVASLASLGTYLNGYAFDPTEWFDEGIPIVKIREMSSGVTAETPRNPGTSIPARYHFGNDEIIFSWSATLLVKIWDQGLGLLNQHLFKVTPSQGVTKSYLYFSIKFSLPIFESLTTGSTMKHIKRKELETVKVLRPTPALIEKFDAVVEPILAQVLQLTKSNRRLIETRDALLPRLISGKLSVDALDIHFPPGMQKQVM